MHLLVFRFSAMGDVALTIPALRGVLNENPKLHVTLVTNRQFEPMFYGIERLTIFGVNLKDYAGIVGLIRLFSQLYKIHRWDAVIDLHSVMRTWVLDNFFSLAGKKVFRIDKGRQEKAALVRRKVKTFKPLKHTAERYLDVFKRCGIQGSIQEGVVIEPQKTAIAQIETFFSDNNIESGQQMIGFAPFSKHKQKTWPYAKTKALLEQLLSTGSNRVFLLGGPEEAQALEELASPYDNCWNMAGRFSLGEEIALMHKLKVVIAMDSFNMHLAALCNTRVVSVWGGTHRYAGFGPLNHNEANIVEISPQELTCRPCSVFGSTPCYRKDWACLEQISPEMVIAKV